jgi:hypothetical protein
MKYLYIKKHLKQQHLLQLATLSQYAQQIKAMYSENIRTKTERDFKNEKYG